jgi:shikimate 5-dehydrogenase
MNEKNSKLSRRSFLLSVGAGGAAGAVALVAKKKMTAPTERAANDKRSARGYAETAHVRNYYRTTKV